MLTTGFYTQLARLIKVYPDAWSPFFIAIGSGASDWDTHEPDADRERTTMTSELFRKQVQPEQIFYLTDEYQRSQDPSPIVAFDMEFLAGEGEGTVRETALIMMVEGEDVLLNHFTQARVEKGPDTALRKQMRIDLRPGVASFTEFTSSLLGNANSRELHNLDNEQPSCRINMIGEDRRHYFASIEEAQAAGYDFCAHCFGRELSQR